MTLLIFKSTLKKYKTGALISILLCAVLACAFTLKNQQDSGILSYTVNPKLQNLKLYWKDDKNQVIGSLQNLKSYAEDKNTSLVFAMNGGMYMEDQSPLGLYIQDQKIISKLNTRKGKGNFYMAPNGVFYVTTDKQGGICRTEDFKSENKINYATQSGPMLVIDGSIHPSFTKRSANLNIRNGVGILPDNKIVFAISEKEINFYDFALFFKERGCKNALYLDGFVSRAYLPEKNRVQMDGNFGVIIGVTEEKAK